MKNRKYESIIVFLKLFFMMLASVYLCSIAVAFIMDVLVRGIAFDISKYSNIVALVSFSIFWALFNTPKYRKIDMEFSKKDYGQKDLSVKVKNILTSMRLKVEKENSNEIVFRSSLVSPLLFQRVFVRIEADKLRLSGANYFLERVADRLKK